MQIDDSATHSDVMRGLDPRTHDESRRRDETGVQSAPGAPPRRWPGQARQRPSEIGEIVLPSSLLFKTNKAPMIFRQLFDSVSGTYTYLLASRARRRGADHRSGAGEGRPLSAARQRARPQAGQGGRHPLHADHITGLGALRDRTHCITVMGEQTKVDVVSMRLADGDKLTIEGLALDVLYTPGHTDNSYSFLMRDRVFTGDTLLIRGTGRTDFQNGDAARAVRIRSSTSC